MRMENLLRKGVREAVKEIWGTDVTDDLLQIQKTRKEFAGDITLVVFPLARVSHSSPEKTAGEIGRWLAANISAVSDYNVIKGFLNVTIAPSEWAKRLQAVSGAENYGFIEAGAGSAMTVIEYSSPNTNKPLHLGHIRNNLLGFSLSRICGAAGNRVIRTNIVNDRGIHICKSMLAWQMFGNGETPEETGKKGDHLVGEYYVLFEQKLREQSEQLVAGGMTPDEAREKAPLMKEARELLLKWEAGDPETVELWKKMNTWVYEGFDVTYKALGVEFDKIYYESDTYKVGRELVLKSLEKGDLVRRDDGSVWIDLTADNLDQKLLLRSDGTAVYMTQDLGTAVIRFSDYHFDRHIYVVGNEQNYHFQVLALTLLRMGYRWAEGLHHFSYGMVELPEGKMKSREGKVVDADDLIEEMIATATGMWYDARVILDDYMEENGDFTLGNLRYSYARERVPQLFSGIMASSKRIKHIVRDLKNYARQGSTVMNEIIDINGVLRAAVLLLENQLQKSTSRLEIAYGFGMPHFRGNFQKIEQVIINILQNACEALADKSGAISIRTGLDEESGHIRLDVADEGQGIDAGDLPHVTDPFYTTKRACGGTGLGLSISSRIMQEHGGELTIASRQGEGTLVSLLFPVRNEGDDA